MDYKPPEIRTDDDVRNIVHPVDPKYAGKRMQIGFDYGSPSVMGRRWNYYGQDEQGQWELRGKCGLKERVAITLAQRHVRLVQTITVIEGVALVESWTWRRKPESRQEIMARAVINFVRQTMWGLPAIGRPV